MELQLQILVIKFFRVLNTFNWHSFLPVVLVLEFLEYFVVHLHLPDSPLITTSYLPSITSVMCICIPKLQVIMGNQVMSLLHLLIDIGYFGEFSSVFSDLQSGLIGERTIIWTSTASFIWLRLELLLRSQSPSCVGRGWHPLSVVLIITEIHIRDWTILETSWDA